MKRLVRYAPFLLIGPISGPLLACAIFNFKEHRPVRGSLFAIAFVLVLFLLPVVGILFPTWVAHWAFLHHR